MNAKKTQRCRVAIVEDHRLQRSRTEEIFLGTGDFDIVFSGETAPAFIAWTRATPPARRAQLLVLDLMVERGPSVDAALVQSLLQAGVRVVVLSALASAPQVRSIVRAGVSGIVGKRDREEDILEASRAVLRGEEWLTTELAAVIAGDPNRPLLSIQEERALVLYASGLELADVATAMNISRETAKQYVDRVRRKYAEHGIVARSKLDLGRIAWAEGYVQPTLP